MNLIVLDATLLATKPQVALLCVMIPIIKPIIRIEVGSNVKDVPMQSNIMFNACLVLMGHIAVHVHPAFGALSVSILVRVVLLLNVIKKQDALEAVSTDIYSHFQKMHTFALRVQTTAKTVQVVQYV